ncbi:MAG: 50S ribosomal protein L2 [Candidatus Aenigmatarchaeota archaeon]
MARKIRNQRKGTGGKYKVPSHRYRGEVKNPMKDVEGEVVDIMHDTGRTAPVAKVKFEDGEERLIVAPEGIKIGDEIECGISAPVETGNILPLGEIPEGVPVYNIESHPGDGGKFARSSGVYGFVVTHDAKSTIVRLPSKKVKEFSPECRATIGVVSGGGRTDKPFMKAGNKSKALKAKGRQYPIVSGVSMNAVDHPFGGSTKPGKPKTVSRNASPGRKVGSFGAKRSGKKKR